MTKELEIKTNTISAIFPRDELETRLRTIFTGSDCYGLNPPAHLLHSDKDYYFARYSIDTRGKEGDSANLEYCRDKGWMPALASEHQPLIKDSGYTISADRIHYEGLVLLCKPKMRTYSPALENGQKESQKALEELKNKLTEEIKRLL